MILQITDPSDYEPWYLQLHEFIGNVKGKPLKHSMSLIGTAVQRSNWDTASESA